MWDLMLVLLTDGDDVEFDAELLIDLIGLCYSKASPGGEAVSFS